MRVTGLAKTRLELRNIADRVDGAARSQMRRSADRIVEEAKILVPEDWGSLMKSIRILRDYAGPNGRLQIDIVAGGQEVLGRDGEINLDQYAQIIHENYEQYKPGKKTLAKMARHPNKTIGSGFLTRAALGEEPKLERNMIATIQGIIQEEQG